MSKEMKCRLACSFLVSLSMAFPALAQIEIAKHKIDGSLDGGFWVHTTDFDQDGDTDILAASLREGLKWYENNGLGAFTRQQIFNFHGAWSIHANDFDNDGDLDVVASSPDLDETAWFERKGHNNFVKHVIDVESRDPHSVYSADLDDDEDIDIVVAAWQSKQIVLWENRGSGNFRKHVLDNNFNSAHSVYAADLDNDGDIEILAGGGGKTAYWRNDGNLNFKKRQVGTRGAFSVFAADIDGDNRLDLLRNQRDNGDIDWFRSTETGYHEKMVTSDLGETWSIFSADLDLDGDTDVLTAGYEANKVSAWTNNGNGGFSERVVDDALVRPRGVSAADIDGDGDSDIVVITRNDQVIWYEVLGAPQPPALTILEPNGGEIFEVGSTIEILWDFTGTISGVDLEYSIDGVIWNSIVIDAPNTGGYEWLTPDVQADMLIRVTRTGGESVIDASDSTFTLVRPEIALTAPNGGEDWFSRSSHEITWTSSGSIHEVNLAYSLDDGATWEVITSNAANNGSFTWVLPDVKSTNVLLRIEDAKDGTPVDIMDASFAISQPTLTLTSPIGAETWFGGSIQTITWNSSGGIPLIDLHYSLDGGLTWALVADNVDNSGSYSWSVPNTDSDQAKVRVVEATGDHPSDMNDVDFSIVPSSVTLTSPNGGENWFGGTTQTITWESTGQIGSLNIEYSANAGADWQTVVANTPDTGSFDWNVPNAPSTSAMVRLASAQSGAVWDAGDSVFTVSLSSLVIASPNGGEKWLVGNTHTITWQSEGPIDSVMLEYSLDGGTAWHIISDRAANSGTFQWTIPAVASDSALIRASGVNHGQQIDLSDGHFSIVKPIGTLTLNSPNGGEFWSGETGKQILWSATGSISRVAIETSFDNGVSWAEIGSTSANHGRYDWQVPDMNTTRALVRISEARSRIPSDVSDATFTIIGSSLQLIAPNGGEEWPLASRQEIRWASTGVITQVKLEYSLNNGINWQSIAAGVPNSGKYIWSVAGSPSESVRIRLSDFSDDHPSDLSDASFRIVGHVTDVKIIDDSGSKPERFQLFQNHPNPFNPDTTIRFAVPHRAMVNLGVFNALGQPVATLVSQWMEPGEYAVVWLADQVPSGAYFYHMQAGQFSQTLRLTLLK